MVAKSKWKFRLTAQGWNLNDAELEDFLGKINLHDVTTQALEVTALMTGNQGNEARTNGGTKDSAKADGL